MHSIKKWKQKFNKICTLSLYAGLFSLSALSFNATLNADSSSCSHHHSDDALELGLALETEFWTLVQNQNISKFSKKLARIFQGLNVSGVYTRDQQIAGLTGAVLTGFELNNPIATRFHDVLVFSYDFVAIGSTLTSGPSITVWKKHDHSWKIISHSYVPFNID